jgi:hypothetical protein
MTLVELLQHFDNCLEKLRIREAQLDYNASYKPCLEADASIIVNDVAGKFTPGVFHADVGWNADAEPRHRRLRPWE